MIPSRPDRDCASSEARVFESLAAALPASYTVLHGRKFVLPATKRAPIQTCEIDFLVMDPARGLLALEVKGGGVQRESDDLWYSIDGRGNAHQIQNPQKQVTKNVYAIREWLRNVPPFDRAFLPVGWGVVFPDITIKSDLASDLPRAIVVDQSDLTQIAASIDRLFDANSLAASAAPVLDSARQKLLLEVLSPSLRVVPLLSDRIDGAEEQLVRMTEEQNDIFEFLGDESRLKVKGTAGSGKTLVALERARREAAAGKRVLFLCFNSLLAQWLRNASSIAAGGTPQPAHAKFANPAILTFHDLAKKLVKQAGMAFSVPAAPEAKQEFWATVAPDLLSKAAEKLDSVRWDSIVVDEGQDFRALWWLAIEKLLAETDARTADSSSLWVFYDPHQDIFGADGLDSLQLREAKLAKNCRNSVRIAEHAFAEIGEKPKLYGNAPAGVPVETIVCRDESEMKDALRRSLHRLVNEEKLNAAQIVVLTPRAAEKTILKNLTVGNFQLVDWPAANRNGVGYCSLQRFKGLESDAIILCEVDRARSNATSKHLYVAKTRAKHVLVVAEYLAL